MSDWRVCRDLLEFEWYMCVYKCISVFIRGKKSMLWLFGESAWSHQLSGYSGLCRNSQLPRPDAGCRALFPEAFLRGGPAWGVHAAQPDRSRKAYKMWWNPGKNTGWLEALSFSVLPSHAQQRLLDLLLVNTIDNYIYLKHLKPLCYINDISAVKHIFIPANEIWLDMYTVNWAWLSQLTYCLSSPWILKERSK